MGLQYTKLHGVVHLNTRSHKRRGAFVFTVPKIAWHIVHNVPKKAWLKHYVPKIAWLIVRTVHKRRGSFVHNVPKKAWLKHYVPKMARLICTHSPKNCVAYLYSTVPKMARLICTVVVHTVPKMAWLICTHCSKNGAAHLYSRSKKLSESPHKTETDPMQWFMFGFSGFCVRYTLYVQRM